MTAPLAISLPRLRSHVETLSRFGRNPEAGGITRSCWSVPHEEARAWLLERMKEGGLSTWVDEAGNTFGRLGNGGPTVLTGSHIDTVPNGGPLDGALGVLAGLECLQTIHESGTRTRLHLMVTWAQRVAGRVGAGCDAWNPNGRVCLSPPRNASVTPERVRYAA
jgi:N-carbamoyl-L-amino-acid hydrolase